MTWLRHSSQQLAGAAAGLGLAGLAAYWWVSTHCVQLTVLGVSAWVCR